MKNFLLGLGIVAVIVLGTLFQINYRCYDCKVDDAEETPLKSENEGVSDQLNGFSFSSNGVGFVCNQNFNFVENQFNAKMPVGDSVDQGIRELKDYLDKNPNQIARINGLCLKEEENNSAFMNLGVARANDVKNHFISKGIPSNRLALNGEIMNKWDKKGISVLGPVNIDFVQKDVSNPTNWRALKSKLNGNPLQLNFESREAEINLLTSQRRMIQEITSYLDNVSGSKIQIVAHTDNVGERQGNIILGQERADFAKAYLVRNGVSDDRIETSSKGPDEPVADNSQDAGRAKNRRTVVLLK